MRRFDHAFQIADTAAVAVLCLLCGLVFKIFAQITERAGSLDLLDQLGHQLQLAVVKLFLHHRNILRRQIVMHNVFFLSMRLAAAELFS